MKVLAIGNSFSVDATRYVHQIAAAQGVELQAATLYIGGCSLERHWDNVCRDAADYVYYENGGSRELMLSIREGLAREDWDVVTMQQASAYSTRYASYQPYLTGLSDYVRALAPNARQMIHQTWAYEEGSERLRDTAGFQRQRDMFAELRAAYACAAADIGGVPIIPCGEALQRAIRRSIGPLHRDTYHASLGIGRYLLGLTWVEALTGQNVLDNPYDALDEPADPETLAALRVCAHEAVQAYQK